VFAIPSAAPRHVPRGLRFQTACLGIWYFRRWPVQGLRNRFLPAVSATIGVLKKSATERTSRLTGARAVVLLT